MFCAPGLVFCITEGIGSRFQVLRARNRFRLLMRESCPIFMFCAPRLFSGSTDGVGPHVHVLRAQTHFRRYRGRQLPFSSFTLPESFSVPRASDPVFMFCAPGLGFGGTEGADSRFHVLRVQTRFQRYRGRRLLFSSFSRLDSFSAVSTALGPIFMFYAPILGFRRY
jgi:hypothetical protein